MAENFLDALARLLFGDLPEIPFRWSVDEATYQVKCPACSAWCEAKIHNPGKVVSVVEKGQNAVYLHLTPSLCVHGHECPDTTAAATKLWEGADASGADQDPV